VQLRNMATIGGNLLQRTRCRYFRDPTVAACNKRQPGSGCAAVTGPARMHAILGASERCIALHASDLAVALVALATTVHIQGAAGARSVPLTEFYLQPGDTPHLETVLDHGELITGIEIPLLPEGARSTYLKVRDRASYEFALTSAGVAVVLEGGVIRDGRVGLGGVGTIPWRAWAAEAVLRGAPASTETFRAAAEAAVQDPFTVPGTAFKVELAKRTLVRALQTVTGAEAAP
jgi:CO/xanthine dehydrogenase FAD-binding subunit